MTKKNKKLIVSPDFTIEDIHRIREWNYERQKNMTTKEIVADINRGSQDIIREL
jgi:hypothetical protein